MEDNKNVRSYNIGSSDYSKHKTQPWDIWEEYRLNPWDADIVKRILRKKTEPGKTVKESRIEDYQKIIHICEKRIDMLKNSDYDDTEKDSKHEEIGFLKMVDTIKAGDRFLCVQDIVMDDGQLAYKAWNIYKSNQNNCITDIQGCKDHVWDIKDDEVNTYFRKIIK